MLNECRLTCINSEPFTTRVYGIEERPDKLHVQVDVYHPAHRASVQIDGVENRFSHAELVILGQGNFLIGIDRIAEACAAVKDSQNKHLRNYFLRRESHREQIQSQIAERYFSEHNQAEK